MGAAAKLSCCPRLRNRVTIIHTPPERRDWAKSFQDTPFPAPITQLPSATGLGRKWNGRRLNGWRVRVEGIEDEASMWIVLSGGWVQWFNRTYTISVDNILLQQHSELQRLEMWSAGNGLLKSRSVETRLTRYHPCLHCLHLLKLTSPLRTLHDIPRAGSPELCWPTPLSGFLTGLLGSVEVIRSPCQANINKSPLQTQQCVSH